MTNSKNLLFLIILLFSLFSLSSQEQISTQFEPPSARNGIMDIRKYPWKENHNLLLDGEWDFWWKTFWNTQDPIPREPDGLILQPGLWNTVQVNGLSFPAIGWATYRLKILVGPEAPSQLGFIFETVSTSYELWVNGRFITGKGRIGINEQQAIPHISNNMATFDRLDETELEIILKISNFVDREGGRRKRIEMGSAAQIQNEWNLEFILEAMLVSTLLVVGLYHILLFLFRPKESYSLSFGLMCLLFAIRTSFDNGRTFSFFFPDFEFELYARFWFIQYYLMPVSVVYFIRTLFPAETKSWFLRVGLIAATVFSLYLFFVPISDGVQSLSYYHFVTLFLSLISFWSLAKAIYKRRSGALIFLFSTLILVLTGLNDILYSENIIQTFFMSTIGLLGFVLCQVYLIAARFTHAFFQVESLSLELKENNKNLEQIVSQRTRKLRRQNRKIFASLRYAQVIQSSVIPSDQYLTEHLGLVAHIWSPKDIVGGDFYWLKPCDKKAVVVVVGDCTGHGIPGALMAMMSLSHLQALHNLDPEKPSLVMGELNQRMKDSLLKQRAETQADDGMDMVMVVYFQTERRLIFSGAKIGLVLLRGTEALLFKGDPKSLGYRRTPKDFVFSQQEIILQKDDVIVLFSDGIIDQGGGAKGYSLGHTAFLNILQSTGNLPLKVQQEEWMKALQKYQGNESQRDDITVLAWQVP